MRELDTKALKAACMNLRGAGNPSSPEVFVLFHAIPYVCTEQDKAHERQKVMETECAQLRQALTSRAAEGSPTEAERCRQAEQLLAQQVRLNLAARCSHCLGMQLASAGTTTALRSALQLWASCCLMPHL